MLVNILLFNVITITILIDNNIIFELQLQLLIILLGLRCHIADSIVVSYVIMVIVIETLRKVHFVGLLQLVVVQA